MHYDIDATAGRPFSLVHGPVLGQCVVSFHTISSFVGSLPLMYTVPDEVSLWHYDNQTKVWFFKSPIMILQEKPSIMQRVWKMVSWFAIPGNQGECGTEFTMRWWVQDKPFDFLFLSTLFPLTVYNSCCTYSNLYITFRSEKIIHFISLATYCHHSALNIPLILDISLHNRSAAILRNIEQLQSLQMSQIVCTC